MRGFVRDDRTKTIVAGLGDGVLGGADRARRLALDEARSDATLLHLELGKMPDRLIMSSRPTCSTSARPNQARTRRFSGFGPKRSSQPFSDQITRT